MKLAEGGFGPVLWSPDGTEIFYDSHGVSRGNGQVSKEGLFAVGVGGEHRIRKVALRA